MSEKANENDRWGPWPLRESGNKSAQPAQPYRQQQANRSEGKWASDVRQSQPKKWDYDSSKWHSSAGDGRALKLKSYYSSEWDGSKWSAPTSRNLSGSGYDTDRDWHT